MTIEVKNNKRGDITIRIPGSYLRHSVEVLDHFENGARVTNTKTFSDEIVKMFEDEQEDGTTVVHLMLDQAIMDADENGCEGLKVYPYGHAGYYE